MKKIVYALLMSFSVISCFANDIDAKLAEIKGELDTAEQMMRDIYAYQEGFEQFNINEWLGKQKEQGVSSAEAFFKNAIVLAEVEVLLDEVDASCKSRDFQSAFVSKDQRDTLKEYVRQYLILNGKGLDTFSKELEKEQHRDAIRKAITMATAATNNKPVFEWFLEQVQQEKSIFEKNYKKYSILIALFTRDWLESFFDMTKTEEQEQKNEFELKKNQVGDAIFERSIQLIDLSDRRYLRSDALRFLQEVFFMFPEKLFAFQPFSTLQEEESKIVSKNIADTKERLKEIIAEEFDKKEEGVWKRWVSAKDEQDKLCFPIYNFLEYRLNKEYSSEVEYQQFVENVLAYLGFLDDNFYKNYSDKINPELKKKHDKIRDELKALPTLSHKKVASLQKKMSSIMENPYETEFDRVVMWFALDVQLRLKKIPVEGPWLQQVKDMRRNVEEVLEKQCELLKKVSDKEVRKKY